MVRTRARARKGFRGSSLLISTAIFVLRIRLQRSDRDADQRARRRQRRTARVTRWAAQRFVEGGASLSHQAFSKNLSSKIDATSATKGKTGVKRPTISSASHRFGAPSTAASGAAPCSWLPDWPVFG